MPIRAAACRTFSERGRASSRIGHLTSDTCSDSLIGSLKNGVQILEAKFLGSSEITSNPAVIDHVLAKCGSHPKENSSSLYRVPESQPASRMLRTAANMLFTRTEK